MARYAPIVVMLISYFLLTVLMNIVFVAFDDRFARSSMKSFSISGFPFDSFGYWALLLLPFAIVPPIAILSGRLCENGARKIAEFLPEFRLLDYLIVTCFCYAVVALAMYRADAWGLLWEGSDAASAVRARFELLDRLSSFERALLQSVLVFLTLYSLVSTLRSRTLVWSSLFVVNLVVMAVLLISLNMKWPVVVLFGGVVTSTALFGKHRIIYSAVAVIVAVCIYALLATILLRIPQTSFGPRNDSVAAMKAIKAAASSSAPTLGPTMESTAKTIVSEETLVPHGAMLPLARSPESISTELDNASAPEETTKHAVSPSLLETGPTTESTAKTFVSAMPKKDVTFKKDVTLKGTIVAAASSSGHLWTSGLVRMALPYPFYYKTFTDEGPVCGTILDRLERRNNPCQPSLLIYERMFGGDGFAGRGTAPAAFHITGYALDRWMGAILETVLVGIVIGAFMAVPLNASAVSGTVVVMGILAAYFFSQLPFEGPLVYDHGALWWVLLVLAYATVRRLTAKVRFPFQRARIR